VLDGLVFIPLPVSGVTSDWWRKTLCCWLTATCLSQDRQKLIRGIWDKEDVQCWVCGLHSVCIGQSWCWLTVLIFHEHILEPQGKGCWRCVSTNMAGWVLRLNVACSYSKLSNKTLSQFLFVCSFLKFQVTISL